MYEIDQSKTDDICGRVYELQAINRERKVEEARIRAIMDGGPAAVAALLGGKAVATNDRLPVANLLLSANNRLAQKIGRRPDIKIDPPITNDSDRAHKAAEKRERIVESYDFDADLLMLLPQLGRWLPGYGYSAAVIRQSTNDNGDPFPKIELRDPYETYPAEWDVAQQPLDIGFRRQVSEKALCKLYPQHADKIRNRSTVGGTGAVMLGGPSWANQSGGGLDIYEYYNDEGCWWVCPDRGLLLSHVPNLLSRPQFHVFKRFSFNQLTGQYDHAVGLMAAMARLNLLLIINVEDSTNAETNVFGSLAQGDQYRRGRGAVNTFAPGSRVERAQHNAPFEAFQYMPMLENMARTVVGYSIQDDGKSPTSFATGRGLQELSSALDLEVREYNTIIANGLVKLDSRRLEWCDKYYPDTEMAMNGVRSGTPFAETYTPRLHIKGDYRTRRVYGAMAGFDDATKILTGLQLLQAELIDDDTMMENIDGLENHSKIKERIHAKKWATLLEEGMAAMLQQGDQRAIQAAIEMQPDGARKDVFRELFAQPAEPAQAAAPELPGFQAPEDAATIMARLSAGSGGVNPTISAQTVSAA